MDYDNTGTLWQTANYNNPEAKCHYSGDAKINGKLYKLFGRRVGKNREFDIVGDGGKVKCVMSAIAERKSDNSPHFRGKTKIAGNDLEVSAWGKTISTVHGEKKILSLRFQPPYKPEQKPNSSDTMSQKPFDDDELPF